MGFLPRDEGKSMSLGRGNLQPTSSKLNRDEAVIKILLILSSMVNLSAHKHEKVSETLFFSPDSIQGVLT